MSFKNRNTKIAILKDMPIEYFKMFFKISIVITFLNLFSVLLCSINPESIHIAIVSFIISLIICIMSYILFKKAKKYNAN